MLRAGLIGCARGTLGSRWLPILNGGEGQWDGWTRVVAVWDTDSSMAAETAAEYRIEAVKSIIDLRSRVDGIIVTDPDSSKYWEYTRPFIEAGIPVFAGFPFASNIAMARQILTRSHEDEAPFMSTSPLCFAEPAVQFARKASLVKKLISFVVTSSFGGLLPGGSGAIPGEMDTRSLGDAIPIVLRVFGEDVDAVRHVDGAAEGENLFLHIRYGEQAGHPGLRGVLQILPKSRYRICRIQAFSEDEILPEIDAAESMHEAHLATLREVDSLFMTRKEPLSHDFMLAMMKRMLALRLSREEDRMVSVEEIGSA